MARQAEKAKRLQPLPETLRRLFLTSGNVCAFPGCRELMIDLAGHFVGQLCHIEAAEPGGERFNRFMTNEQRRAFENLMLMCHGHHVITNDVEQYSVSKLKDMKVNHETMFSDPAVAMVRVLEDVTAKTESRKARSLKRLNEVLAWGLDDHELEDSAKLLNGLASPLQNLPKNARVLVRIIVERAGSVRRRGQRPELPFVELAESCNFDQGEISRLIQILERHGFAQVWEGEGPSETVGLNESHDYPSMWFDFLKFSRKMGIPLKSIIDDVQFHLLD
jgi:hypothetical protein